MIKALIRALFSGKNVEQVVVSAPEEARSEGLGDLTQFERSIIEEHEYCPDCKGDLLRGPTAPGCINVKCASCETIFWLAFCSGKIIGAKRMQMGSQAVA